KAIEAAFKGHGSLKHVWVVDTDVDIYDPAQVEWAMATRFQADKDLMIFPDQPGSSLDPSGIHEPGQKSRTAKLGLDCTIPWGADKAKFTRGEYGEINITDYIS
ncbi:MAG: UbiD family decarboxylase, partial [Anaerolineae bacterium]|nr:UbiD family decarboxylase [Anaerolineae bacterium]